MGVEVLVGVGVKALVGVEDGLRPGVEVLVGVTVLVGLGVLVGVLVGVTVLVGVGVGLSMIEATLNIGSLRPFPTLVPGTVSGVVLL